MKHKTLYFGGHIITCNLRDEVAEAMVTEDDKILFVGDYDTAHYLVDADTEIIHIGGRAIIPTFADAHYTVFDRKPPQNDYESRLEEAYISAVGRGFTAFCEEGNAGEKAILALQKSLSKKQLPIRVLSLLKDDANHPEGTLATCFSACGISTGFGNSHYKIGQYQMLIESPKREDFSLCTPFARFLKHLISHGISVEFRPKNRAEAEYALWCLFYLEKDASDFLSAKMYLPFSANEEILYLLAKTRTQVIIPADALLETSDRREEIFENLAFYQEKNIPFAFCCFSSKQGRISPFALLSSLASKVSKENQIELCSQHLKTMLRAMTLHGAVAVMQEKISGSLEWGKSADFLLLSASPFAASPAEMKNITPLRVVCTGKILYDAVDTLSAVSSVYLRTNE